MTALGLTPDQLPRAFPFHFVAGADLRIVQVGPAWDRVAPTIRVGAAMADVFRLQWPQHPLTPEALRLHVGSLLVLECLQGGLPLRGQFMAAEEGSLIFLGSPLLRDPSDLAQFKLSLTDWPPHDPVGDYEKEARRARQVLEGALDAVITIDGEARVMFWNTEAEQVFGWTRAEAVGQPLAHLIIPERLHAAHAEGMRRHLATGETRLLGRRVEMPARHRTGREFPVELTITAIEGDDGRGFSAFVRDVTSERRTRDVLRSQHDVGRIIASAQQLSAVMPGILEAACCPLGWSGGAIWLMDRRSTPRAGMVTSPTTLLYLSSWADTALTATPFMAATRVSTLEGSSGLPRVPGPEQAATVIDLTRQDLSFARRALALDAGIRWAVALPLWVEGQSFGALEFFWRPTERPVAVVVEGLRSIARQVGQFLLRERSQGRLVAEQQRLTRALEGGELGTWDYFPASNDGTVDEWCMAMLGRQPDKGVTSLRHWATFIHPHDLPVFRLAFEQHLSGETDAVAVEARIRHKDGHWLWVLERGRVFTRDAAGMPSQVSGTILDISKRKEAERAQRQSDVRVRAVMDNLLEGVFLLDDQQRIL